MISHRVVSGRALALACALSLATFAPATFATDPDLAPVRAELAKEHAANVQRLRDWVAFPSIAAEKLKGQEGAEYQAKLLREAGFDHVEVIQTDGQPGVFLSFVEYLHALAK